MKFTIPLLTILATVSVYSIPVKRDNGDCKSAIENAECTILNINVNNESSLKQYCSVFHNENCQNIFKNGLKNLEGCNSLDSAALGIFENHISTGLSKLEDMCPKSESDKSNNTTNTDNKATTTSSSKVTSISNNSHTTITKTASTTTSQKSTPTNDAKTNVTPSDGVVSTTTAPLFSGATGVPTANIAADNQVSYGVSNKKYTKALLVTFGALLFTLF